MSESSRSSVWVRAAIMAAVVCWGLAAAPQAAAQAAPIFSLNALNVGACRVVVTIDNPRGGDRVGVVVDQTLIREQTVVAGNRTLEFGLSDPLRPGSTIVVRVNGVDANGKDGKPLRVQLGKDAKGGAAGECQTDTGTDDDSPFEASFFLGEVVDNFAPDIVANYKA